MFDSTLTGMCQDCAVTSCADCSDSVDACKTCMDGYTKGSDGNCAVNSEALPCASGYSKVSGVCEACPPGCASCDGLQCTSCMDGVDWVKPSTEAADMCSFNCTEYACTNSGI